MILEEWINVFVRAHTKKYYESKGYICDINIHGIQGGTYEILCHIDDLLPNSHVTVTRICDECGKIDIVKYQHSQFNICEKCSYKYRCDYKFKCIDCGKLLMRTPYLKEPRCKKCHRKYVKELNDKVNSSTLSLQDRLTKFWEGLN